MCLGVRALALATLEHLNVRSGWSVSMAWERWPSWSVKDSCAPGCARSRLMITLDAVGHADRSRDVVISAICLLARSLPSVASAETHAVVGDLEDRVADRVGQFVADRGSAAGARDRSPAPGDGDE